MSEMDIITAVGIGTHKAVSVKLVLAGYPTYSEHFLSERGAVVMIEVLKDALKEGRAAHRAEKAKFAKLNARKESR